MIESALQALAIISDPTRILFMLLGIGVGLLVGLLPGLSGTVGMAMLLPFIYGMDPYAAIALLIGMAAVIHTADTFPSVLLGVPGSSGSQATILDGYPLARRGEAARALGAAFFASMVGGLVGAVVLFAVLPIARPLVLTFGSPELFMLTVLGLAMVGVLSGNKPLIGILAGTLGLLVGSIGAAPAIASYRFTFGSVYLFDGLPIAVVALGLFALPEILDLLIAKRSVAATASLGKGWLDGVKDVVRERWLTLRCAVLGVIVGAIPGMGGAVVDWISYGQAVQIAKDKEGFGKGDIRGVIAPEASNNAKEGGTLIPTLLFGIPGSGTTAVLLGGFILLGLQPGPRMVTENLDITLAIVWTLALANVIGAICCLLLSGPVSRLSLIPAGKLAPFLLIIMMVGAYQSTRDWGDLLAFIAVGLLGWLFKHIDWPRPPLLIGYVLSISTERYLHLSVSRYDWNWLLHPGVLVIGVLTVALVLAGMRLKSSGFEERAA
jgi:putative tricarboxylic transport membrane protein